MRAGASTRQSEPARRQDLLEQSTAEPLSRCAVPCAKRPSFFRAPSEQYQSPISMLRLCGRTAAGTKMPLPPIALGMAGPRMGPAQGALLRGSGGTAGSEEDRGERRVVPNAVPTRPNSSWSTSPMPHNSSISTEAVGASLQRE